MRLARDWAETDLKATVEDVSKDKQDYDYKFLFAHKETQKVEVKGTEALRKPRHADQRILEHETKGERASARWSSLEATESPTFVFLLRRLWRLSVNRVEDVK
jgi:hypothetical protein